MVKLNKKRIKWLVDQVVKHEKKPKEVSQVYSVGERRVQQLVKQYKETKKYPELNENRRPRTSLTLEQEQAVEQAYGETLLTPRMLYYELKRRSQYAPKNKIYLFLKVKGLVRDEPSKQKKRKRCRYEWPYTGDMLHADYHRSSDSSPHCIFWLDDHSRRITAGGEFESPNAANALGTFKQAEKELEQYDCTVLRVNTDRASVFLSNKEEGTAVFEEYCRKRGVRLIPSSVGNPQTNGKVERRWFEYDKHRWRFKSLQDWIDWYNDRLTTALDIEHYETPNAAFLSGLPNVVALFWRLCEHDAKQ